jgi:putative peptidoglycan lipid II flippase
VNVLLKVILMRPMAQVGLALATSIGAWLNLALVTWFAARQGHFAFDHGLRKSATRLAAAGCILALVLWLAQAGMEQMWPAGASSRDYVALLSLALIGALAYGAALLAFFGRDMRKKIKLRF